MVYPKYLLCVHNYMLNLSPEGSTAHELAAKVMRKTVEIQQGLDELDFLMVTPRRLVQHQIIH